MTGLHYAAFKGNLSMVRLFLEASAPVNVADDRGLTPLMMAANSKSKDPDVVRLLLDHGADIQAKDDLGRTPTAWARIGGRPEIVKMLAGPVTAKAIKTPAAEPKFKDVHTAVAKALNCWRRPRQIQMLSEGIVDFAYATCTDGLQDLVSTEFCAAIQTHLRIPSAFPGASRTDCR